VPAATYAAAFVLMVLTMITVRTAGVLIRSKAADADIPTGNLHLARGLT
jgi:hypothetical protein